MSAQSDQDRHLSTLSCSFKENEIASTKAFDGEHGQEGSQEIICAISSEDNLDCCGRKIELTM